MLLEGAAEHGRRKARQSGTTRGSGPHERAPGEPRQSDKEWVEQLANEQ